jgi:hypothetical protein
MRKITLKIYIFYLAIVIGILIPPTLGFANTCRPDISFFDKAIKATHVVIRGEIISYQRLEDEDRMARLKFKVVETYKGVSRLTWVVAWQSNFSLPKTIKDFKNEFGEDLIVGLVSGTGGGLPTPYYFSAPKNKALLSIYWVMESECLPPVMGPYKLFKPIMERHRIIK